MSETSEFGDKTVHRDEIEYELDDGVDFDPDDLDADVIEDEADAE